MLFGRWDATLRAARLFYNSTRTTTVYARHGYANCYSKWPSSSSPTPPSPLRKRKKKSLLLLESRPVRDSCRIMVCQLGWPLVNCAILLLLPAGAPSLQASCRTCSIIRDRRKNSRFSEPRFFYYPSTVLLFIITLPIVVSLILIPFPPVPSTTTRITKRKQKQTRLETNKQNKKKKKNKREKLPPFFFFPGYGRTDFHHQRASVLVCARPPVD